MLVVMSQPEVYQPLLFLSSLSTKKEKRKKLFVVFSDTQVILCRVLVQTAWLLCFLSVFPLISKSLVLKSEFKAVSVALSYIFQNGRLSTMKV